MNEDVEQQEEDLAASMEEASVDADIAASEMEASPDDEQPAAAGTEEDGERLETVSESTSSSESTNSSERGGASEEVAASADTSTRELQAEVDRLSGELAGVQEQLVRQVATFRNYRRRTEQEKSALTTTLKGDVVKNLLDVVDDFERTFEAADAVETSQVADYEEAYASFKEGVELIYLKLMDELKRLGVEPIEAEGLPFNEKEHDAMMQQPAPDDDTEQGTILQEIQRGYRLGDRILRHSKVIVAE